MEQIVNQNIFFERTKAILEVFKTYPDDSRVLLYDKLFFEFFTKKEYNFSIFAIKKGIQTYPHESFSYIAKKISQQIIYPRVLAIIVTFNQNISNELKYYVINECFSTDNLAIHLHF